ncbi:MAG: Na/Pi symporter [Lentisphaeria bacterium]
MKLHLPPRLFSCAWLLISILLLAAGCNRNPETVAAKLTIKGGDMQTGRAGEVCGDAVVVELLGPRRPGLFGGKGTRRPVPDKTLVFEPTEPASRLEIVGDRRVKTDSGGHARAKVKLGKRFGDQYLRAYVEDNPDIYVRFRFVSGIIKKGDNQEAIAGDTLPNPLSITVTDSEGTPQPGVPVYFSIVDKPGKNGELKALGEVTNDAGVASANFETDPDKTGKYKIIAEVVDPERGLSVRGLHFTVMSLNRAKLVIGVLGGLGIFILGMKMMSSGLREVAGNRLKSFLHFFTKNRIMAVFAGTAVTGLIQSSSACSVMVVGFVNAGLISLRQAIGVIFGANIGTTVTAQMISLNIKEAALPAVAIGVALLMLARRSKTRSIANAILGFGLLFLGMTMMSSVLKGIADFPSFINIFQTFNCKPAPGEPMPLLPVMGAIGIGTAMTVLIQSSSATIGLAIALAASGLINFYTAVPLILGDNIGTTVTALLASIGTNRPARQSAIAHTIFNVLGATYMVLLLYVTIDGVPVFMHIVNTITMGEVFAEMPENIGRHIASAHTLFNVFNVLLFLPLVPIIAWLCNRILPVQKEKLETVPLEPHLLDTPAIAIDQSIKAMVKMVEAGQSLTRDCVKQLDESRIKAQEGLQQHEDIIDHMQHDTIQYLTELTHRYITENQATLIPLLVHCVNDAERLGDHAMNILELAQLRADSKTELSESARQEINHICDLVSQQAEWVQRSYEGEGEEGAARALKLEGEINQLTVDAEQNHIKRLEKDCCSVKSGILYTEIIGNLERIADRQANIAERSSEIRKLRES